jgi:hypothetical protein
MAERYSMRARKGDMKIDLHGLNGRIVVFIDRDKVKDEKRARINERIEYLQHLALTISKDEWPAIPREEEAHNGR